MTPAPSIAGRSTWPLLALLMAAVLVPTAAILWFMAEAVRNERLAAVQRVSASFLPLLQDRARRVEERAGGLQSQLRMIGSATPYEMLVEHAQKQNLADAILVFDTSGTLVAPARSFPASPETPLDRDPRWLQAERLEFQSADFPAAAGIYAALAADATSPSLAAARARIAHARALHRSGETTAATSVLLALHGDPAFSAIRGDGGRLLALDAGLQAWRHLDALGDPGAKILARKLLDRIDRPDPDTPPIPLAQRIFITGELTAVHDQLPTFQSRADQLAARALESNIDPSALSGTLVPFAPGIYATGWQEPLRRVVLLHEENALQRRLTGDFPGLPPGVGIIQALKPDDHPRLAPLREVALTSPYGWRLALIPPPGPDPFAAAAGRRVALYFWIAGLLVTAIAMLVLTLGRRMLSDIRLARLKNDFIATVTHELKTPLASSRVLLDTLLAGSLADPRLEREYLELIATENTRLCRLIDNFLTFSRMERGRQAFDLQPLQPSEVVHAAVKVMRDRLDAAHADLQVSLHASLPAVRADRDALVTVLVNLLDNALKYTPPPRRIALRASAANGTLRLEVEDNGIGIPRRAQRRIFERFYQVDRSLSRETGGCGLGLSIVRFIVDAHHGTVGLDSESGRGSRFTVTLPAEPPDA